MATLTNNELDELRSEEAYREWTSSLWKEEEMREEGMRINGNSFPAFIQILLAMYVPYRNYQMRIV
jgi:hypothetical protein